MQVILRENVENLGRIGDIVKVSDGYARNFLIPRSLVYVADESNVRAIEHHKKLLEKRAQEMRMSAQDHAKALSEVTVSLARKVGEHDKLFGSVSAGDIVEALTKAGHKVEITVPEYPGKVYSGVVDASARSVDAQSGTTRMQIVVDNGAGELSDAAAVLDWMNTLYPNPSNVWVCGISFGAWIGMQLLMRRPEITGFISIAPPANMYDFAFLAPCPASGLFLHGTKDQVVPEADVQKLVDRLSAQKGIKITYTKVDGANHFFDKHMDEAVELVGEYAVKRMASADGGR